MDGADKNTEIKINIGKREPITEPLDTTPHLVNSFVDAKLVAFGNTGLDLLVDEDMKIATFDFYPEDGKPANDNDSIKHATMFCMSLLALHNFLNDPKKLSEFKIDISKIPTIGADTNDKMIKTMNEIFSKSDTPEIVSVDRPLIDIDVQKFKNLDENDSLIKFLNRVADREKGMSVTYVKPVYS